MKKRWIAGGLALALAAGSFGMSALSQADLGTKAQEETEKMQEQTLGKNSEGFVSITMDQAREIFKEEGDYLILDVRRADEYAQGHIPGAVQLANEDIKDQKPEILEDPEQTIYVYCRSGRRSREAAGKLAALGCINVIECGGILDWKGEIEV